MWSNNFSFFHMLLSVGSGVVRSLILFPDRTSHKISESYKVTKHHFSCYHFITVFLGLLRSVSEMCLFFC